MVAEDAELDSVMSHVAYNIVLARADFVQEVRAARGNLADWGGGGVRAADADGLIHVAHGSKCRRPRRVFEKLMEWSELYSKVHFVFSAQRRKKLSRHYY